VIFKRIRHGWIRRAVTLVRWSRVMAYAAICLAGVFAILRAPASVAVATGPGWMIQLLWAILMTISAAFCAWGAARDHWIGEYIGLVPLAAVAAAFGVSALTRGQTGMAGGMFLIGFFWLLVSRWQEVALLRIEADRQAQLRNGRFDKIKMPGDMREEASQPASDGGA
jgi:hypothetical protein